jgi:hypothetical protein
VNAFGGKLDANGGLISTKNGGYLRDREIRKEETTEKELG